MALSHTKYMTHQGWETVIGLEIHLRISTQSKLFSSSPNSFREEANTDLSLLDMGTPGMMPRMNQQAIKLAACFGMAIHAKISPVIQFDRKHYIYYDLPKGYQITQTEKHAIVQGGYVDIKVEDAKKRIHLSHAHLEEDAGKLSHSATKTYVDLNRAGMTLLEIVTKPDFSSAKEVISFLKEICLISKYLKVSDANLQEGSMRCDVNISVRPTGTTTYGVRAEIKNLNSFKFIEQAIEYERNRQIQAAEAGESRVAETRSYHEKDKKTYFLREKESVENYYYFPELDIIPMQLSPEWLQKLEQKIERLPEKRRIELKNTYPGLQEKDINWLIDHIWIDEFFESCNQNSNLPDRLIFNWIAGPLMRKIDLTAPSLAFGIQPMILINLLQRVDQQDISSALARKILDYLWNTEKTVEEVMHEQQCNPIDSIEELQKMTEKVFQDYEEQHRRMIRGHIKLVEFFFGKIMEISQSRAHPQKLRQILEQYVTKHTPTSH